MARPGLERNAMCPMQGNYWNCELDRQVIFSRYMFFPPCSATVGFHMIMMLMITMVIAQRAKERMPTTVSKTNIA